MKRPMKRLLCLVLALCLVGQFVPMSARATLASAQVDRLELEQFEEVLVVNPLYADVITEADLNRSADREYSVNAVAESEYLTDFDEAVAVLREGLVARQAEIVIYYSMEEYYSTIFNEMFAAAREHTGNPREGDTLEWGWGGMSYDFGDYSYTDVWYLTMIFTPTYYTTAEQEAELDVAVDELLATVDRTASDYEQIKTLYDYICANVTYDYANLNNKDYKLKYTAYAAMINGTAVCQGYALLLYRLALELGIDARLVPGDSNGDGEQDHGWNIVCIDGKYYNADSTWDAGRSSYSWFLRNQENFVRHTRTAEYDTEQFHAAYPMGQTDYDPNAVPEEPDDVAKGTCGDNLTWVLDKDGVLTISGTGEMKMDTGSMVSAPWYDYSELVTSVVIQEGVTTIGHAAFYGFCNLTDVEIPLSVTSIDQYAFMDCWSLTGIELPASITSIGNYAFAYCTGLTSVELSAGITTIGDAPFANCERLTGVYVDDENQDYYDWNGLLYSQSKLIQVPGAYRGELVLHSYTYSIGNGALKGCTGVTVLTIPASLQEIGRDVFSDYGSLTEIRFQGDAPAAFAGNVLEGLNITVSYPDANTTWTEEVKQTFGGTAYWTTFGENLVATGYCGESTLFNDDYTVGNNKPENVIAADNAIWTLTDDGTMTISGKGKMVDSFYFFGSMPWTTICSNDVTRLTRIVVAEGITNVGSFAFGMGIGECVTEVILPSTIAEIGPFAFHSMPALESIRIPENVQKIHESAFGNCTALETVEIPAFFRHINRSAFADCSALTEVRFLGDAPTIGENAFANVTATAYYSANNPTWTKDVMQSYGGSITWVAYDINEVASGTCGDQLVWSLSKDGVLTISGEGDMINYEDAFDGQPWQEYEDSITCIRVEGTVRSIGSFAFYGMENQQVVIGDGVASIGKNAFSGCAVTDVLIPDSVTAIGEWAFSYCTDLTSVEIGAGVTAIGAQAFHSCGSLKEIRVDEDNACYSSDSRGVLLDKAQTHLICAPGAISGDYSIPEGVATIEVGAFYACDRMISLVIPDSMTTIGDWAFSGCANMVRMDMGNGVVTIGDSAFRDCISLTELVIPDSVTTIGEETFSGCNSIVRLEIGSGVTRIDSWAMEACPSLKEIFFRGAAPSFGKGVFAKVTAEAYYPANNPTWTDDKLQDYGGTITWIAYSTADVVDSGWSGDTTWELTSDGALIFSGEGNMKTYGSKTEMPWFDYLDQITCVVLNPGVTSVSDYAFYGMEQLERLVIPGTVTSIGQYAFKGCTGLDNVILPEGLTRIGEAAFYGCTSLKEIYIPDSIYTVVDYTFKGCTSLESVRLSKELIKVGQGAFENCTSLDYIYIPGETEIIGSWSFKGCTALVEADMQWADATEIREGAFKNCSALTEIILPTNIQILGDSCFYGIGATSFTVPATVTKVDAWCFARAYSLKTITFEGDAPTIGEGAFNKITLTAFYPAGNDSWTPAVMQNYGGTVTWNVK